MEGEGEGGMEQGGRREGEGEGGMRLEGWREGEGGERGRGRGKW